MGFKDAVAADIGRVFLNANEFAEEHTLEFIKKKVAVKTLCIVQDVNTKENLSIDKRGDYYPGAYGVRKMVNVATNAVPEVPVYGQAIKLDGKTYEVESCDDDMGVLTIILEDNRA